MAKILIAYFSHAGQNYSHGGIRNLPVGNTEVVAKKLHAMLPSDLFYIDTVQKYPDDHMKKIEIAKREYEQNARPELTARVENMDEYDTVILAFPNWWTTMPMAVFTFLDRGRHRRCAAGCGGGKGEGVSVMDLRPVADQIKEADAILIGASNGLSITEGLHLFTDNAAFEYLFGDLKRKYGLRCILQGAGARWPSEEEKWAFWSRLIHHYCGTYQPTQVMKDLKAIVGGKDYFIVTSNGEGHFEMSGFARRRSMRSRETG